MGLTLTVLVDTYNYGRFIREAIQSVLSQKGVNPMEILVVDDGSTDNTEAVVSEFGSRITYLKKTNGGQASCLNFGIARAKGDVVCLLDADDLWMPEKLYEVQTAFEQDRDALMVQHYQKNIDQVGRELHHVSVRPDRKPIYTLADIQQGTGSFSGTSALSFRRSFLAELGPIPDKLVYCPDEYLYTFVHFYGRSRHIGQILSARRLHGSNPSSDSLKDPAKIKIFVDVRTFMDGHLSNEFYKRGLPGMSPQEQSHRDFEIVKLKCLQYRLERHFRSAWQQVAGHAMHPTLSPTWGYRLLMLSIIAISPALHAWISRYRRRSRD